MAADGEQKRLEDAAGPHGARTTELVGVDDIGLPTGIQPEDVQEVKDAQMDPSAAAGGQQSGSQQSGSQQSGSQQSGSQQSSGQQSGGQQSGGAPSPVAVGGGQDLSPGDEAAPGTVGSGDDVCPVCSGSGKSGGGMCPNCRGAGVITEGIGGG